MRYILYTTLMFFFLPMTVVQAQNAPLELSASEELEWNRTEKTYTAKGDVEAKRGQMHMQADVLLARYDQEDEATDISRLEAHGHVVLISPPYKAYGDKARYDIKNGHAVLTGKKLRVETETEKLTAKKKIVYDAQKKTLSAVGQAMVYKETQTLAADTLTAFFVETPQGKMETDRVAAQGHVVITTENEEIHGTQGVYDVKSGVARLSGNVRIFQGKNWLEGSQAIVDMTTGVSRLLAADRSETQGRVKGIFYPKTDQDKKLDTQ